MVDGSEFKFAEKPLLGKMTPDQEQGWNEYKEMAAGMEAEKPGSSIMTADNIVEMREMWGGFIESEAQGCFPEFKETATKVVTETVKLPAWGSEGETIDLLVTKPKDAPASGLRGLVYSRGGGGVSLLAKDFQYQMDHIAANLGIVVFNVGFRNAPEVKQPAPAHDVITGIKHVYENADKYGVDKSRIGVWSESGGSLNALSALRHMGLAGEAHMVKAHFMLQPMISLELIETPEDKLHFYESENQGLKATTEIWKMHATDFDKQRAENDPVLFVGRMSDDDIKKLPKTAVLTSEFDEMRRDCLAIKAKLEKNGKLLGFQDVPGCMHGYFGTSTCSSRHEAIAEQHQAILAWI